jgi:Holliday junction DNA helicase RuvA
MQRVQRGLNSISDIVAMINHLSGKLIEKNPAYLIVECAGVGYFVNITLNTFSKVGQGEHLFILTHLQITEDNHTLYGFINEDERRLFRLLITVSGIGCNTARMMLSSMTVPELESCIIHDEAKKLQGIKGIGEKTALRTILELKSKLKKDPAAAASSVSHFRIKDEAMSALMTLGFNRNAVDKTLESILKKSPDANVEDVIKDALKSL